MGLVGTPITSLSASGNSWKELLFIASIILSQQTHILRQRTYLPLMTLITKALCLPVRASTIPVLLLAIHRSAWYRISRSLLIKLLLFDIRLRRKFNWREGVIIGCLGVTVIWGYLKERDIWRWVSSTAMTIWFGLVGGYTTVNIMAVTALHIIMTHSCVSLEMFVVWITHNNDYCLG